LAELVEALPVSRGLAKKGQPFDKLREAVFAAPSKAEADV